MHDRLHPDDLQALVSAMIKGVAPDPHLIRQILQEELTREREHWRDDLKRMIHDEARRVFDEDLPDKFALISLRIDNPDSIERTRRMIDSLKRTQEAANEVKTEVWRTILKALGMWLAGIFAVVLGYAGLKSGAGR